MVAAVQAMRGADEGAEDEGAVVDGAEEAGAAAEEVEGNEADSGPKRDSKEEEKTAEGQEVWKGVGVMAMSTPTV